VDVATKKLRKFGYGISFIKEAIEKEARHMKVAGVLFMAMDVAWLWTWPLKIM
jgi:hypothetical protein